MTLRHKFFKINYTLIKQNNYYISDNEIQLVDTKIKLIMQCSIGDWAKHTCKSWMQPKTICFYLFCCASYRCHLETLKHLMQQIPKISKYFYYYLLKRGNKELNEQNDIHWMVIFLLVAWGIIVLRMSRVHLFFHSFFIPYVHSSCICCFV